ncbi:LytR C-terminal domain-containing protein, partial [Candidatus Curtissbacteria bacterium]|nr:LytR C-terminal domain-containing protein [Candidatus Curtissbacteria bacterium]
SPVAGNPIYQESQGGKNAKWLWFLIAIIIIGALAFAFVRGIGPFGQLRGGGEVSEPTLSESFVASPSPEVTPATSVDKTSVKIRILNGSGQAGVASAAKDFIEGKGWEVASLGNAANFDFAQTVIKLKESALGAKDALVADLADKYSVVVSSESLEATDSADVEVTIGAK